MGFEPIAIVGRGCVLPGALDPRALWANIAAGRVSLGPAPAGRWRLPEVAPERAVGTTVGADWSGVGGYVRGFEGVFDPEGFLVGADTVRGLDPCFQWTLHGIRQALHEAGIDGPQPRAGLVMGNLSLPTEHMARYAEHVWRESQASEIAAALRPSSSSQRPDARNRFSSGLPALLAAKAFGLGAGAFCLDAACASSLYAIKLACDRLHDGTADLMVAGAVSAADDLFIRIGFAALSALSRTGRSRPFHREADGLVPAEGAAFVALMRLSDAVAQGRSVLGVVRGVGLSNDGRAGGPLSPSAAGQVLAMRRAYESSGIEPASVSLVECHATGTPVGDAVEARVLAEVFAGASDVPIGSAKSNLGHAVAAAGAVGLLKAVAAMDAGVRPPTCGAAERTDALDGTPLRLLLESEPWDGPRRAAVSAFGFGGNNAHLIVEQWDGRAPRKRRGRSTGPTRPTRPTPPTIAIVSVGARVGSGRDAADFERSVMEGLEDRAPRADIEVGLDGLRVPPGDLGRALGQQVLLLEAAREAVDGISLPSERTMLLAAMGCDPEAARSHVRWRVPAWFDPADAETDGVWLDAAREAFAPTLDAAGVLGAMPNLVANRISAHLDITGPGFTVSAEQASGPEALALAARALVAGEVDAALVGAVDLSHEPVHNAALAELGCGQEPGDAAVMLVLKRLDDARRAGEPVLAVLAGDEEDGPKTDLAIGPPPDTRDDSNQSDLPTPSWDPAASFGTAHAAAGLVSVAAAALVLRHRATPRHGRPADPSLGARTTEVTVPVLDAPSARIHLSAGDRVPYLSDPAPRFHIYSGQDAQEALAALDSGHESDTGPARLVVLAADAPELAARGAAARRWLTGGGPRPRGVAFRATPIHGEVAFVYTNGSAAYPGMGRDLMLAFPAEAERIEERCGPELARVAGWAYGHGDGRPPQAVDRILGASVLSQLHTLIARRVLGLEPRAVLGYSSGESAALAAMEVWRDLPDLVREMAASTTFTSALVGDMTAVRPAWETAGVADGTWSSHLVAAPVEQVREALAGEQVVHLMAVNAPGVSVIGGEDTRCRVVLGRLPAAGSLRLDYDIVSHVPEVAEVREEFHRLHRRPTHDLPGVRFHTGATGDWYVPGSQSAADAITAQALGTIRFDRMVERAWADGARIFVELGPRALCTSWIARILDGREHVAVAFDTMAGESAPGDGVRGLTEAVAELVAAGVPVDLDALTERFATAGVAERGPRRTLSLPAHPDPVRIPAPPRGTFALPEAPQLPPVVPRGSAQTIVRARQTPGLITLLEATSQHQRLLTEAMQGFLSGRAEIHQAFLRSSDLAARLAGGVTKSVVFTRADLERHASEPISHLFGPRFAAQDGYRRQTRMPGPPMLLADRVVRLDAEPAGMGTGTVWTETDVAADAWYLDPAGRMPAGIAVEAGQADLLLASWLGVDLRNQGERVYRLLGCEVTFHAPLPRPGETLRYEISVDGHGELDSTRLMFFRFDCYSGDELRLTVRGGQAGFFTDAELAATGGVLWDPAAQPPKPEPAPPNTPPPARPEARAFNTEAVRAFAEGRPADCFGEAWRTTRAHVRSPAIGTGRMQLITEVTDHDPEGGPRGRGYLRARTTITPQDWFFEGHFKNDPCMPGTLMLEGCLQAMAFHLAAAGFTIDRDGWSFQPVPDEAWSMICRGQVTPAGRELVYEVFVSRVTGGERPTIHADVLCTVDGVKSFLARGLGLALVPDWPLAAQPTKRAIPQQGDPVADHAALLASAQGRPSEAFPELYSAADDARRVPRLPGPPFLLISRITSVDGPAGRMTAGIRAEAEYDVPDRAWYFEPERPTMPLSVLMEIALQPCGWLASHAGCAIGADDVLFRNLDGTATVHGEVGPDTRTVRTAVRLTSLSRAGGLTLVAFDVECFADGRPVFTASTGFGFFPPESFADQPGLPAGEAEGGATASLRAEQEVDPGAWYFKAHFLNDPVQPGSLGVQELCRLLPGERVMNGRPFTWKYRGQVVPTDRRVTVEAEIRESGRDELGEYVVADAWLSVDGKRIYHVTGLGMRADTDTDTTNNPSDSADNEHILDPAIDTWLADHRPTWTAPTLPMTSMLGLLADAARRRTSRRVTGLCDVRVSRWLPISGPVRIGTEVAVIGDEARVTLLAWREAATAALSRFEAVAEGVVLFGAPTADRLARGSFDAPTHPLPDTVDQDPYEVGALFHGPAFQYLTSVRTGADSAVGILDAARGTVPPGLLNQGLLDAATHVIPHDDLRRWSPEIPADVAGFPHRIAWFESFAPLPDHGEVEVEARFAGFDADDRARPCFDLLLSQAGNPLAAFRLVDALVPKGRLGTADRVARRAFLRDRRYANGLGLSATTEQGTRLSDAEVREFDWLPGTVDAVYGLAAGDPDRTVRITIKDHIARLCHVHPSAVDLAPDLTRGWPADRPDEVCDVIVRRRDTHVLVVSAQPNGGAPR